MRSLVKPPKYNGKTAFETFYAHFQNCASYNRWNKAAQLAHLRASLIEEAGQVLWDSGDAVTNSLTKLTHLLKERFGGAANCDKHRMELSENLVKVWNHCTPIFAASW